GAAADCHGRGGSPHCRFAQRSRLGLSLPAAADVGGDVRRAAGFVDGRVHLVPGADRTRSETLRYAGTAVGGWLGDLRTHFVPAGEQGENRGTEARNGEALRGGRFDHARLPLAL